MSADWSERIFLVEKAGLQGDGGEIANRETVCELVTSEGSHKALSIANNCTGIASLVSDAVPK